MGRIRQYPPHLFLPRRQARHTAGMTEAITQVLRHLAARELSEARSTLRHLAQAGDPEASLLEVTLTANGTGAAPDWRKAYAQLADCAARFGGEFADQLAIMEQMDLDRDGYPKRLPEGDLIDASIQMQRFEGFLSPAECAFIARTASDILAPSMVADARTGAFKAHPVRRSSEAPIGPTREALPIQAILRRIAKASGTAVTQGEALTVLHYAPGQEYRPHLDTLPDTANQRQKTFILYLNDAFDGGATHFDVLGITVKPRAGDALVFDLVGQHGSPAMAARHAGLPVTAGAKWIATRWIRARPFDVWRGPEAA